MGLKEVQEYITKLKKAEKLKEIREQVSLFLFVLHSIAADTDEARIMFMILQYKMCC